MRPGWSFSNGASPAREVNLGGLVGVNNGTIRKSRANAFLNFFDKVDFDLAHYDNLAVGSVAGKNSGLISQTSGRIDLYAYSNNVAQNFVMDDSSDTVSLGGIAGVNQSTGQVKESEAQFSMVITNYLGDVFGEYAYGGIVGLNAGLVENSYSAGMKVSFLRSDSSMAQSWAGGIVGINTQFGQIKKSLADFSFIATVNTNSLGGIVGKNLISSDDASYISSNLCVLNENKTLKNALFSFESDPLSTEDCLLHPLNFSLDSDDISVLSTHNNVDKTLPDMNVGDNPNPSEGNSIWILGQEKMELRSTMYWFNDI